VNDTPDPPASASARPAPANLRNKGLPCVADVSRHIFAKRPRCRACGSAALVATRTIGRDGDAVHRYVRCRQCGGKYVLVLE
jgi:DNA-directed RNA polymerase subunit RPC12/RpoP